MNLGSTTLRNSKFRKTIIMCNLRSQPYFILLTYIALLCACKWGECGHWLRNQKGEHEGRKKEAPRKRRAQLEGHMQHKWGTRLGDGKVQEGGVGVRGGELPQVNPELTTLWTGKGTDHQETIDKLWKAVSLKNQL